MKPVFVTSNPGKLNEAEEILGFELGREEIELEEIQSVKIEEVVGRKARDAYEKVKGSVIVTDTGLYIEDLNGFPGALIKYMFKRLGNRGVTELAGGSEATAATVVGYFDGENFRCFRGEVQGRIAEEPKGNNGFGWDPIFIPEGTDLTFAEMDTGEKNSYSMRKEALEKMEQEL